MSAFQFGQAINITVFLFILFLIVGGKLSTLWRLSLPLFVLALIIAILAIGGGGSSEWYWLPKVWVVGFPLLFIASLATRKRKTPFNKNLWDGHKQWPVL